MWRAGLSWVPLAAVVGALWLVTPGGDHAFSTPKTLWLAAMAVVAGGALWWNRPGLWLLCPLGATALSALGGDAWLPGPVSLQLAFGLALFTFAACAPRADHLALVGGLAGGVVAVVTLLQAVGLDPFSRLGPEVDGRLRVYGTLGNPDFVASALSVTTWWAASLAKRLRFGWALVAVHLLALVVTRSFATVAAGLAGVVTWVVLTRSWRVGGLGLVALGLVAAGLAGRSPRTAFDGRAYLVGVAFGHVSEAVLVGHGPGAVEALWPQWEAEFWASRCADASCVTAHPQARFVGVQDHVHADWLERWLEQGLMGVVALAFVAVQGLRRASALEAAALVTCVIRGLVDFPLARPADLALFAAIVAVVDRPDRVRQPS